MHDTIYLLRETSYPACTTGVHTSFGNLIDQLAIKNASLFEFEKTLEGTENPEIPRIVMAVWTNSLFKLRKSSSEDHSY
jgi:hypothetical protein